MDFDQIPLWALFLITIAVVSLAIELGYRVGKAVRRRSSYEKESAASVISTAILSLSGFMLAFTFGIVAARYDVKRELVRNDANAIRTAWLRSEFLPDADRAAAATLFRRYVGLRLEFAGANTAELEKVRAASAETHRIQDRLWNMAAEHARKDMDSEIGALYVESLNEVIRVHANRIAVGLQARVPFEIWIVLYVITILGMTAMGYQTAIAESHRSKSTPLLVFAFSVVMVLIAAIDRPDSGVLRVTQQPLADLRDEMDSRSFGERAPSTAH